ncbi:hypothetical protein [Serratia quinivorans]|nr:hypothetical protein [Serratia quinivorans]
MSKKTDPFLNQIIGAEGRNPPPPIKAKKPAPPPPPPSKDKK